MKKLEFNDIIEYIETNPDIESKILNEISVDTLIEFVGNNLLDEIKEEFSLVDKDDYVDLIEYDDRYYIDPDNIAEESVIELFKKILKNTDPLIVENKLKELIKI